MKKKRSNCISAFHLQVKSKKTSENDLRKKFPKSQVNQERNLPARSHSEMIPESAQLVAIPLGTLFIFILYYTYTQLDRKIMKKRNCNLSFQELDFVLLGLVFMNISCFAQNPTNITTDQAALLTFKAHISSDPYQLLSKNWSVSSSVCDWTGITCGNRHRRVISLNISNMGLTGTIPPHIGNLSFLLGLTLTNNHFHGSLPPELGRLRRLRALRFTNNDFSGDIPTSFGSLTELRTLSLWNNSLSGPIPSSLSNLSKLEWLSLSNNSLEGTIPAEMGNLQRLNYVFMIYNKLSGPLPKEMFNISSLELMGVVGNFLTGDLPNAPCSNNPGFIFLGFDYNLFSGQIPQNLSHCSKLEYLGLSNNRFDPGFIPKEVVNLANLQALMLDNSFLKGKNNFYLISIAAAYAYLSFCTLQVEFQKVLAI